MNALGFILAGVALAYAIQAGKVPPVTWVFLHTPILNRMIACTFCLSAQCGFWFYVVWQLTNNIHVDLKPVVMNGLVIGLATAGASLPIVFYDDSHA